LVSLCGVWQNRLRNEEEKAKQNMKILDLVIALVGERKGVRGPTGPFGELC